jgi:catechol 1,2-dioxygenase
MESMVRHLHEAIKEVRITPAEWMEAITFLTRTGQISDNKRQEFILLSDVLGVSMLVDTLAHDTTSGATANTVLGPFHVSDAPHYANGADIRLKQTGEAMWVAGGVRDTEGRPVAGANLDVWQADDSGFYDVQRPNDLPEWNLRGQFTTDGNGHYDFITSKPLHYPIPSDGPVGDLLNALDRPFIRPAHLHFIVTADGYAPVITHYFDDRCPYLQYDPVLGVKSSLLTRFEPNVEHSGSAKSDSVKWTARCDFVLARGGDDPSA